MRILKFLTPEDGSWSSTSENVRMCPVSVRLAQSVRISKTSGSSPTQTSESNSNRVSGILQIYFNNNETLMATKYI